MKLTDSRLHSRIRIRAMVRLAILVSVSLDSHRDSNQSEFLLRRRSVLDLTISRVATIGSGWAKQKSSLCPMARCPLVRTTISETPVEQRSMSFLTPPMRNRLSKHL